MCAWKILCLWAGIGLVSGCGYSPKVPPLSAQSHHPIDKVVLSGKLDRSLVNALFNALNQDGKLSRLKKHFDSLSDAEVDSVLAFLNNFLYQDALRSDQLVGLLRQCFENRCAQSLVQKVETSEGMLFALRVFQHQPEKLRWLQQWASSLDPRNDDWILRVLNSKDQRRDADRVRLNQVLVALRDGMTDKVESEWYQLWRPWRNSGVLGSALNGLNEVRRDLGEQSFEDLGVELRRLSKVSSDKRSSLSQMVSWISLFHRPTQGIFHSLSETIRHEPSLNQALAPHLTRFFLSQLTLRLSSRLRRKFETPLFWMALQRTEDGKLSPKAIELFNEIRAAMEESTSLAQASTNLSATSDNLNLYLNALALTRWLMAQSTPELREGVSSLWSAPALGILDWGELFKIENDGLVFADHTESDLNQLGLKYFADDLPHLLKTLSGDFLYDFRVEGETRLEGALGLVITELNATRPLVDTLKLARFLLDGITDSSTSFLALSDLESENLLTRWHELALALPETSSRRLVNSLQGLSDLKVEGLSKIVGSLFKHDAEWEKFGQSVVTGLPILGELKNKDGRTISLLEWYLSFLKGFSRTNLNALSDTWREVDQTRLMDTKSHWWELVAGKGGLMSRVSQLASEDRGTFAEILKSGIGQGPDAFHRNWVVAKAALNDDDRMILLSEMGQELVRDIWSSETKGWRRWLLKVLVSQDWEPLISGKAFEAMPELLSTLETLDRDGTLKDTAQLMLRVSDPHLRALASLLVDSLDKGEFNHGMKLIRLGISQP